VLQFIQFDYLSSECFSYFLSALPDSIDRRLWESISRRFISRAPPVSASKSLKEVEFPLKNAKPGDGVISYLTQKHRGNVHDKGIVTVSSQSVFRNDPRWAAVNVVDLTSDSKFSSMHGPGEWICWDFHEMRVRPTSYTIGSYWLKSWVGEGSLDCVNWTEIDRKTDTENFKTGSYVTASFTVSNSAECRFIRLTSAGRSHTRHDSLSIAAFEVFGTLLE
jgi:hypothetical protein